MCRRYFSYRWQMCCAFACSIYGGPYKSSFLLKTKPSGSSRLLVRPEYSASRRPPKGDGASRDPPRGGSAPNNPSRSGVPQEPSQVPSQGRRHPQGPSKGQRHYRKPPRAGGPKKPFQMRRLPQGPTQGRRRPQKTYQRRWRGHPGPIKGGAAHGETRERRYPRNPQKRRCIQGPSGVGAPPKTFPGTAALPGGPQVTAASLGTLSRVAAPRDPRRRSDGGIPRDQGGGIPRGGDPRDVSTPRDPTRGSGVPRDPPRGGASPRDYSRNLPGRGATKDHPWGGGVPRDHPRDPLRAEYPQGICQGRWRPGPQDRSTPAALPGILPGAVAHPGTPGTASPPGTFSGTMVPTGTFSNVTVPPVALPAAAAAPPGALSGAVVPQRVIPGAAATPGTLPEAAAGPGTLLGAATPLRYPPSGGGGSGDPRGPLRVSDAPGTATREPPNGGKTPGTLPETATPRETLRGTAAPPGTLPVAAPP
ncbi:translation initiation factor IF-2-like [Homarus americanus]|uniref:translation initiation factor IF-2-like n=1 Tax=Homarus americanus TaxID=6706 RepID=UPI001C4656AB|nr:translation initiation factor IF-2-like [Homarus americanus]